MIPLHRLTHPETVFFVNPDLILTVESTPDTVITLTTAAKLLVNEKPFQIAGLIREWRASILTDALVAHHKDSGALAEVMQLSTSRVGPPGETG
jgi:flagellar protein FlbD